MILEDFEITSKIRNVHLRMRGETKTSLKNQLTQTEDDFIFKTQSLEKQTNGIILNGPLPSSLSCQVTFLNFIFLIFYTYNLVRVSWRCQSYHHLMKIHFC